MCARSVTQLCPLFATPWTIACHSPLSMGFSRQENGLEWVSISSPYMFLNTLVKKKKKQTCNLEGIPRFTLKRYLSYLGSYDLYTHSFKGLLFFQIYTNCLKVSQQTRVTKNIFFFLEIPSEFYCSLKLQFL